jgi:hypothetical protein
MALPRRNTPNPARAVGRVHREAELAPAELPSAPTPRERAKLLDAVIGHAEIPSAFPSDFSVRVRAPNTWHVMFEGRAFRVARTTGAAGWRVRELSGRERAVVMRQAGEHACPRCRRRHVGEYPECEPCRRELAAHAEGR